jgi:hypothetical protein
VAFESLGCDLFYGEIYSLPMFSFESKPKFPNCHTNILFCRYCEALADFIKRVDLMKFNNVTCLHESTYESQLFHTEAICWVIFV